MEKKYIIDCDEQSNVYRTYQDSLGRMFMQLVPKGGGMLPYTEPDLEQVRKEAYKKGYEDAENHYCNYDKCANRQRDYQNGLNDAWECARKIAQTDAEKHYAIFGIYPSCDIFKQYTASEAIDRIRLYEEKDTEIKIGDEVNAPCGKAVVIGVENDSARYVYSSGEYGFMEKSNLTRTGRYFPEIATILEKIKK